MSDGVEASIRFPDSFLWGAATSAFQIEGSPLADGAGPSNLASLRAHSGTHRGRRDRRRGLRSLPPLRAGRGAARRPGGERVPVQRVLEPRAPRGTRAGEHEGARLLRASRRHAPRGRHPALRHPLSLGSPRRSGRSRRMAQPRHRRVVRRLRAGDVPSAGGPRRDVGDPERALGGDGRGLPPRRPRPGSRERVRGAARLPQPAPRPRGGGGGVSRGGAGADRVGGEPGAQGSRVGNRGGSRGDSAGRRLHEPPVSRRGPPRPLPGRACRDLRRGLARVPRRGLRSDRRADRLARHQLLHAVGDPARRRRAPGPRERRASGSMRSAPSWAGKCTRRASPACCSG